MLFIKKYSLQTDSLTPKKKKTSGIPKKHRWETGWSPNKAIFFTYNTGESMTTSFISVQKEISWRVLSAKGAVVQVDGGE